MSELSAVARPYAQAAFELAQEQGSLPQWSDMLGLAATVSAHPDMVALIHSPRLSADEVAQVFVEVCGDGLDDQARNLVKLLARNERLVALSAIASRYERLKAEAEQTVQAQVISARPLDQKQQRRIRDALKKQLGREVVLECQLDESLIAGAVIRAGDLVTDGSALGKLEKLANVLTK